jgi:hypothetical protein
MCRIVPRGFDRSGDVLKRNFPDLVVSKQKPRRADTIACVRLKRQEACFQGSQILSCGQ